MLYEKETLRLNLFPDMILAGILLAVSICLMLIAFVVLRFTISFTLQEEYRQIGVMKAIGLSDTGIRGVYLAKYFLLSVIGAAIGFFGSIPFSGLLLDSISQTMVMGNENSMLVNAFCSIFVVVITLAFCYGCTGKVKKYTPVDAIRNGTTGERFQKKGLLQLSRTPGRPVAFLALNDVLSQPRRFGTIILTLFLCLSMVLMLTTSINTLKSNGLIPALNMTHFDIICSGGYTTSPSPEGSWMLRESMEESKALLRRNGMDCRCYAEVDFSLALNYGEKKCDVYIAQGVGTTTDQYVYFEGSAPSGTGEIGITKQVAQKLGAGIGDTITMQIGSEKRDFLVTGHYQTMMNQGMSARIHQDEVISYEYLISTWGMQVEFLDDPGEKEIVNRIPAIMEILDVETVQTEAEYVEFMTGMAETLEYVRLLILAISLIIIVLITVLIGHSFMAKERGEIAVLKAIGFRNSQIISWQALRFVIICIISAVLAIALHLPIMKLAIDPIFTAMGAYFGIEYKIVPLELYCIYPALFLAITSAGAFLTAQHIRTVQTSECSNID
jgi:putative ABC transport system permease protein